MTKLNVWTRVCLVFLLCAGAAIASQAQATYKVLYNLGSNIGDPVLPGVSGILAQGRDGNLYSSSCRNNEDSGSGDGTAYSITPTGVLTAFPLNEGMACPTGGLTLASDGNFYGTAAYINNRGTYDLTGAIFKLTPNGEIKALHKFDGSDGGAYPTAPPIQAADGNFYGTTEITDFTNGIPTGNGTIYRLTSSGAFSTIYVFDFIHGARPFDPLVQGTDGYFYGTAQSGGVFGGGVIFKATSSGQIAILHSIGGNYGFADAVAPLIQGSDGNFYGTLSAGGDSGNGLVFQVTPAGKLTTLHSMNGITDGADTFAGLIQATDGNFYGVNSRGANSHCHYGCGTIFRLTPAGEFTVLYSFDGATGRNPESTLIQHTNGLLYGATSAGGIGDVGHCGTQNSGCGVFFSLDIGLAPFVRLVNTTAKVGGTVQILGEDFTGTTDVSVNGTAATFTVVSDTYLTAKVPSGATSGFVTVTTPGGTLTSNKQLVIKP